LLHGDKIANAKTYHNCCKGVVRHGNFSASFKTKYQVSQTGMVNFPFADLQHGPIKVIHHHQTGRPPARTAIEIRGAAADVQNFFPWLQAAFNSPLPQKLLAKTKQRLVRS
jgi:hypothetical protein